MSLQVMPAQALDAGLLDHWRVLRAGNPSLISPYYTPEFTLAVAEAGREVWVAVLEIGGQVQGFFPHERLPGGQLGAVGSIVNDYHGWILGTPDVAPPKDWLRDCQAWRWAFNHLPCDQTAFTRHAPILHPSPILDLRGGWHAYVERLAQVQGKAVPGVIKTAKTGLRKLTQTLGPVQLHEHDRSPQAWAAFMRWKSAQFQRTGQANVLDLPWVQRLLAILRERHDPELLGPLSTLWAGDTLLACHMGLQNPQCLHYWLPTYNPDHASLSPGLLHLHEMARQAADAGVSWMDMGRGDTPLKQRFMTGAVPLCEGMLTRPGWLAPVLLQGRLTRQTLREVPWLKRSWDRLRGRTPTPPSPDQAPHQ